MFNYIGMKVSTANQNLNYVLTLFWIKSELLQITISILCKEYIAFNQKINKKHYIYKINLILLLILVI